MNQFKKVIICETKCKTNKSDITDISTYKKELKKFTIPTELVGGIDQLVKPYFDIDTELSKDTQFDEQAILMNATEKIKKMFKLPNTKDIYILKRDKREKNGKYKYSYHITVDNICIYNFNIKKLLDDAKTTDFDTGVYDKNRALHPIYTSRKVDKETDFIDVPEFKPYDVFKGYLKKVDIVKYCPSYIMESFVDWNVNFAEVKTKKMSGNDNNIMLKITKTINDDLKLIKSLIGCLSKDRCENYKEWLEVGWCLFNINFDLLNVWIEFSKNGSSYKEGECENLWDKMKKSNMSIGTLRYWAKNDNVKEYNTIIDNSNLKFVKDAIGSDGAHYDVANVCYNYYKGKLYYDVNSKSWYKVNEDTNIWKQDKEGLEVQKILATSICKIFMIAGTNIINEITDDTVLKALNDEKFKKCIKIATKLKDENFCSSIRKQLKCLCATNNFVIDMLDTDINTFAFSNCLFDLKNKVIRNIEPQDHICTTTGYDYNLNVCNSKIDEIKTLISDMFKTEEMYEYLIDILSTSMFGKNLHQEFYIFNGAGSNGKSLLMSLLQLSYGGYCEKINATTFTKESKSANETSELHSCKASRLIVVEEPNENEKLITSRLKEFSGDTKIKTRGLHENAFCFQVMFSIIFFCNEILKLSKVDKAVGRRLRLVNFPMKFCDNPIGENEKLIDMSWAIKMKDDEEYKQAFMLILWENWCSKDLIGNKIKTPLEVMEITKEYMDGCNDVKLFMDEFYEITNDKNDKVSSRDIFTTFKGYYKTMDEKSFSYNMNELGIEKKKTCGLMKYIGIKMKNNDDDSDNE